MSVGLDVDVDLDENVASIDLFDENDELRLEEFPTGWRGLVRDGDRLYAVDTRYAEKWFSRVPITDRTARRIIARAIAEPGGAAGSILGESA